MAGPLISLGATITDNDDQMERILREIEDAEFDAIDIGILSDADELLRIYASANEFGTRDGRIPERSFIRRAIDDNEGLIDEKAQAVWAQIIDGRIGMNQGLALMGEFIQRLITQTITAVKTPVNADSTIARKKSSNPLIDTSRMRQSIRWQLASSADGKTGI